MRIGLIQPPPLNADRPSIGLSIMASVAKEEGHDVDLVYSNLHCAHALGIDRYNAIAHGPNDGLVPDIAFVRALKPDTPLSRFMAIIERRMGNVTDTGHLGDILSESLEPMREFLDAETERIVSASYDVVGFTVVFSLFPSVVMARLLRERGFKGAIIFGGSHCEGPMGVGILELVPDADYVVRGYAEKSFPSLLRHIQSKANPTKIAGVVGRGPRGLLIGPPPGLIPMDDLPFVSYEAWFDERARLEMGQPETAWVPLETARGCWYGEVKQCTFCGLNGEQMRFTSKSPNRALQEFKRVSASGARQVYMTDPILDRRYFKELLPNLAQLGLPLSIFYEVKSNIDDADIEVLSAAGVRAIQPGIESLSSHVLALMKKGVRAYQNIRLLVSAARHGVGVGWNLLYGFTGETQDDYDKTAQLIPLLYHLEPPGIGDGSGGWVRMDRFSPMHEDPESFGLTRVRPHEIFSALWDSLGVDSARTPAVSWASYYFDFDYADGRRSDAFVSDVMEELRRWHDRYGVVHLVGAVKDGAMYVVDSRSGTEQAFRLEAAATAVLDGCMEGVSRVRLKQKLTTQGFDAVEIDGAIGLLLSKGLLIDLDERLLSLVVRLDYALPKGLPEVLIWPALKFSARQRHASRKAMVTQGIREEVAVQ